MQFEHSIYSWTKELEEALAFADTLYRAGPQPELLRMPFPSCCVTRNTHISTEGGPAFL
jgi:hypothetical protein